MKKLTILGMFLMLVLGNLWAFAKEQTSPDSPKGPPDCVNCKVVSPQSNGSIK